MTFAEVLALVEPMDGGLKAQIPDEWRQGRTGYGGLTAALCLHAARELTGETRALRSAMISFVGPSQEDLTLTANRLRSGKSIATVAANLDSGSVPATHTILSFSDLRENSVVNIPGPVPPSTSPPENFGKMPEYPAFIPAFMRNFDIWPVEGGLPYGGQKTGRFSWWMRHNSQDSWEGEAALLCIADGLPPAATAVMPAPAPLSSATWMVNMLQEKPTTEDGWWLLQAEARHAAGGYTSQTMTIWNSRGDCVVTGAQMVTIFA